MADSHKNFPYSTVATAPIPATSGTSLVLAAGGGALMPVVPFNAPIWPTGVQPLASNAEIVRVTAIAGDTLTISRQQEGTSARTIVVGDQFAAAITAQTLQDSDGQVQNSTSAGQTLTIRDGFQFVCKGEFVNRGDVINRGEFIVL